MNTNNDSNLGTVNTPYRGEKTEIANTPYRGEKTGIANAIGATRDERPRRGAVERPRGGVYNVDYLKQGVSVIAGAVKLATSQSGTASVFDLLTNGWSAIQHWRDMWNEVTELDWDDALELGKAVASEVLPFIGGLFGVRDIQPVEHLALADSLRVLAPYTVTTRGIDGYTEEELVGLGDVFYAKVFPHFAGVKVA